jgi:GNAT superfamily N-acetyltransferase/nitroimidazol reductase NimA-like FMN-containing flavoprotein (pyridoxamine 5'-phosphate oxidase superfamily)
MRKAIYEMPQAAALALLRRAPWVHVAGIGEDGAPVLRVVNGVVFEDRWLVFHGADAGEKVGIVGREVVVSAHEPVAQIPSHFVDPELACPATTWYLSAQVRAVLERVDDPARKAAILSALMERFQPEGGYAPITAQDPRYRRVVDKLLVCQVPLDRLVGKGKLGQNRTPAQLGRILSGLWARGESGDPRAMALLLEANEAVVLPPLLSAGGGLVRWSPCLYREDELGEAAALLATQYWQLGVGHEERMARLRASVCVGARCAETGGVVVFGRAYSDEAGCAWVHDVVVAPAWRGRGLGEAVMRLLLDHPRVRGVRRVRLGTRDAQGLYEGLGFVRLAELPSGAGTATLMERAQRS